MIGKLKPLQFLRRLNFKELTTGTVLVVEAVDFLDASLAKSPSSTSSSVRFLGKLENIDGVFSLKGFQVNSGLRDKYPTAFFGDEKGELFERSHAGLEHLVM